MPILHEDDSEYLITVAELKSYLRIDFSEDDTLLADCIAAATNYIEYETELDLIPRQYSQQTRHPYKLVLTSSPVLTIDDFQIDDFDVEDYTLVKHSTAKDELFFNNAACDLVEVTYSTGFNQPFPLLKQALLWSAVHFYMQREPEITGTITSPLKLGLTRVINQLKMGGYA